MSRKKNSGEPDKKEQLLLRIRGKLGKIKSPVWIIIFAAVLFVFVEGMPEAAAFIFERKNLNRYQTYERTDEGGEIHYSMSTAEKMQVLSADDLRMSELFSIGSLTELNAQAPDLLNTVERELANWQQAELIFWETGTGVDALHFESAQYYTICNSENANLTVNVWFLQFTFENGMVKLFVDAESGQIYGISIPNTGVADYVSRLWADLEKEDMDGAGNDISERDRLLEYWANRYAEQLRQYYSADYMGSDYVLPELNIVNFIICFETESGVGDIVIPYYVSLKADEKSAAENNHMMCVTVFGFLPYLSEEWK